MAKNKQKNKPLLKEGLLVYLSEVEMPPFSPNQALKENTLSVVMILIKFIIQNTTGITSPKRISQSNKPDLLDKASAIIL
ncbi:MAG TPA: hypothetical protein DD377_03870 [Firmicutes bacterium]|nr:hypothetical protein [Bacillota bacterium]